jgi:hypothetical protein
LPSVRLVSPSATLAGWSLTEGAASSADPAVPSSSARSPVLPGKPVTITELPLAA